MNPNVMYIENKNKEKWSTGTNLWAVKPVRKSVTLNPGACMPLERKIRKTSHDGEDLSDITYASYRFGSSSINRACFSWKKNKKLFFTRRVTIKNPSAVVVAILVVFTASICLYYYFNTSSVIRACAEPAKAGIRPPRRKAPHGFCMIKQNTAPTCVIHEIISVTPSSGPFPVRGVFSVCSFRSFLSSCSSTTTHN